MPDAPAALRVGFLGTRGEIDATSERHRRHSVLLLTLRDQRVMIDCGLDWLDDIDRLSPDAIVVTHAHPDHAGGLRRGAPCPVYATEEAWRAIDRYGIRERIVVRPRASIDVCGLRFEAFAVEHSLHAPAVGYRVSGGDVTLFYVPDVVSIPERGEALAGLRLYVGDGATVTRPIVRRRDGALIGHAPIRAQLDWCAAEGVPWAIFTHCGSQLVRGEAEGLAARVEAMGRERGMLAEIASDGMEVTLTS